MTLSKPTLPSTGIPLFDGYRASLVNRLDARDSRYELSLQFPDIIKEFENLPLGATRSAKIFEQDPYEGWTMMQLFHAIPDELLRSIVLGTVAYDDIQHQCHLPDYSEDGLGVYVIAISIEGRNGAFLNTDEIEMLTQSMATYLEAYEAAKVTKASRSRAQRVAISCSRVVDGQYRKNVTDEPYFVRSDAHADQVKTVISWFERRVANNSPGDLTFLHQCPLYVGCSRVLKDGLKDSCLTNQLDNMSRLLGFTLSIISSLGLTPKITKKVPIKIWQDKQLPVAEVLLIALSQSPYAQGGFNVQDGGNTAGTFNPSVLVASYQEVMFKPHLRANLERSLKDLDDRRQFIDNHATMRALLKDIVKIGGDLEAAVDQVRDQVRVFKESGLKSIEMKTEQLTAQCVELESNAEILEDMLCLFKRLKVIQESEVAGEVTGEGAAEEDAAGEAS
ncbi:hypothetical protein CSIM01_10479 [Colletotrichum simmondsii]|uniref:Uncharacterized protein n=1 Tax=Colletotrichum simmondsii TaxID=703756 RepID=A0A135SQG4_9PEZI|nr:hypothetical protein CSIM01_10479 [Colletotrichum simmondsii]